MTRAIARERRAPIDLHAGSFEPHMSPYYAAEDHATLTQLLIQLASGVAKPFGSLVRTDVRGEARALLNERSRLPELSGRELETLRARVEAFCHIHDLPE